MSRVRIRLLRRHEEYRQCESLQMAVWGNLGAGSELLSVTQKYGGVVMGALADGKVVGFIYAFPARRHGRFIHWSHMMAVEPGHRDQGLGFRMKLAHRRLALERGIKSICWTYDPLQSRNATLNICRLGAQAEEYVRDCYGHFPSLIEKGLPSDRLVVNWRIASARIERRLKGKVQPPSLMLPRVNETRLTAEGMIENQAIRVGLRQPRLLVEIPANTDEMRVQALRLARRWRMETRRIFTRYFAAGYAVADFLPPAPTTDGRCFYVLSRHRRISA
jgi:predicted GNAT superfamily acetyltransferase